MQNGMDLSCGLAAEDGVDMFSPIPKEMGGVCTSEIMLLLGPA